MTIDEIKRLIANGETRTLELKKTTGELKDGMHTACAFLNTEGGWLLFGITPKSCKLLGQQVTDSTRQEIANALSGLEPMPDIKVEYVDVPEAQNGEQIIALQFECWVWGKSPYTYHGCPYYKIESTTKVMPKELYEERMVAAQPHKFAWDKQVAEGYAIEDLDEERVRETVRLGVAGGRIMPTALGQSIDTLLGKLHLKKDDFLTNAAVMLFAKDTYQYPQLLLRMARFDGNDKNVFIDNRRVRGNFFDLLDAGIEFVVKHLNLGGRIVGLKREDRLEIPLEALREALINALCHRMYNNPSGSVSIAIYDNRVEIENPGRLPNALTVETMKQPHDSYPMNTLIADVLFLTTFLDSWGSGVHRMVEACKVNDVDEPVYELRPGGIAVVFKRHMNEHKNEHKNEHENEHIKLSERQRKIVELITTNPSVSIVRLAELVGVSESTLRRELKIVAYREGPNKGGRWLLKTVISEDG